MNTSAAETLPLEGSNIVALVETNPVMVLTDRQKFSEFYEAMRRETDALDADVESEKAREADRAHRGQIMGAAKEAIMEAGPVDEAVAKAIVLAIAAGGVPHISIRF